IGRRATRVECDAMRSTHPTLLGAWLAALALAGGCGDVQKIAPDGGGSDGSPTADGSAPGTATVEVHNLLDPTNSGPLEDVPVLFFGPDGELSAEEATGADGRASATVEPGSTAVVLMPLPSFPAGIAQNFNFAIAGMQPGDEIVLSEEQVQGAFLGSMTFTLEVHPAAVDYEIHGGCSRSGTNGNVVSLNVYSGCVGADDRLDLLAVARDNTGAIVGTYAAETTFAAGAEVPLPGTWLAPDTFTVRFAGLASQLKTAEVRVGSAIDAQPFALGSSDVLLKGAESTATQSVAAGFGDSRVVGLGLYPAQVYSGEQDQLIRVAPDQSEVEITSDDLLPWYTAPIYSSADRSVSWAATGGSEPDVLFVAVSWTEKVSGASSYW